MTRIILLVAILAGCAAPARPPVPTELQDCRPPPSVPAAPPRIRTPDRLARFAVELELAREAEHRRGDECAERLQRLNAWIQENRR